MLFLAAYILGGITTMEEVVDINDECRYNLSDSIKIIEEKDREYDRLANYCLQDRVLLKKCEHELALEGLGNFHYDYPANLTELILPRSDER